MEKKKFTEEGDSWKFLDRICQLFNLREGIISLIRRAPFYHDEPKLFNYVAFLKDNSRLSNGGSADRFASSTSFNQKKAFEKAVGEAIERYCLSVYKGANFINASYQELGGKAIDPTSVVSFSSFQLRQPKFKDFIFNERTKFKWICGYSLTRQRKIFVPSQLVFVPYKFKQEKIIRLPITTGAACGQSLEEAIYRGICEVVERDAFIISYLNKMPGKIIKTNNSQKLKQIFDYYQRYNLTLYLVDITTDLEIPVILGLLIDKTGLGPAVSVGAAADISAFEAAIKASEEAQHSRPWIRREMESGNKNKDPSSIIGRGLYWAEKSMISKLSFWLKGRERSIKYSKVTPDFKHRLKEIVAKLKKVNLEVIYVDVTLPKIKKVGFWVVRVIIPELQPLYLEEDYPYLGGQRLFEVPIRLGFKKRIKGFNSIPHPFL